jgi:hypothetical protein
MCGKFTTDTNKYVEKELFKGRTFSNPETSKVRRKFDLVAERMFYKSKRM